MKPLFLAAAFCLGATSVFAGDPREIGWEDLEGPRSEFENPFESLDDDQMQDLARILRLDYLQETDPTAEAQQEAAELRAKLTAQGVDADFMFEERLRIMNKLETESRLPNDEVVGQIVRLPGYLLPLEMDGTLAVEFLLVPTVGACVHTPPPPANQVVHVVYPEGFSTQSLFTPVWITGKIRNDFDRHSLYIVDGETDVDVTYTMQADTVVAYDM